MNDANDDLAWLAFRYVAGETTAAETAAFESQLADSQAARDAVVQAMALARDVMSAESLAATATPPAVAVRPAPWGPRVAARAALAAAACALLMVSLGLLFRTPATRGLVAGGSETTPRMVEAWSERFVADAASAEGGDSPVGELAELILEPDNAETALAADAPDWMVEAVQSLQSSEAPEDSDAIAPEELEG
jgi:hypothetical protein